LQKSIPREILSSLNQGEKKLYPFYEDLDVQFQKLRRQLE